MSISEVCLLVAKPLSIKLTSRLFQVYGEFSEHTERRFMALLTWSRMWEDTIISYDVRRCPSESILSLWSSSMLKIP